MRICLKHAQILTPSQVIEDGTVIVADGRIRQVGPGRQMTCPEDTPILDASGLLLVPGFIDLQLNGGFGHDFTQDPQTIWEVAPLLPQYGVTAFLPTLVTTTLDTVQTGQHLLAQGPPANFAGAFPLGLHLEGPFLNPAQKGAHNPNLMRTPSLADTATWTPDNGVRLVTLAPELPGGVELIRTLAGSGVIVSAGHSAAAFDTADSGFDAGIRYGTHLFNAMSKLHHREPGLAGALLSDDRITLGLICDGIHVHPALIRLVWQLAAGRINLVSDAMAALGMPPGVYRLGHMTANVGNGRAQLPDGTLAGSILSLDKALRNLLAFTGCPLNDALATLTTIPGKLLSLNKGKIAPGYDADLVLLSPDLEVQATIVAGRVVFQRPLTRTAKTTCRRP